METNPPPFVHPLELRLRAALADARQRAREKQWSASARIAVRRGVSSDPSAPIDDARRTGPVT